jgi:GDP-mannose 6-dehydrogenase
VGTPGQENGGLDLTSVRRVCLDIGQALRRKQGRHIVVLRSTVLPGTTEEVVIPILEQASGQGVGQDWGVCFNPEFLREGTSVFDHQHPPFVVIGSSDHQSAETLAALYQSLDAPLVLVSLKVAEMLKYTCNAFHALKVTFANEIGNICEQQGIDSQKVMEIFCLDQKLNLSPYYLKPGFAFGGSCLPKDLRALLYHGRQFDLNLPVLEAILSSNELQVKRGFEMIRQTGKKKVGVLGLSFKEGTDDLRESPLVELVVMLIGKGYSVRLYDPNVSLARLVGSNRVYIESRIPHIVTLMCNSMDQVLAESEVVVIGSKAVESSRIFERIRPDQVVIDLVRNVRDVKRSRIGYQGICW